MNTETVIKMVGDFFVLTAEDFTPKQLAVITEPRDLDDNMRTALFASLIGKAVQAVTVTVPADALTGDYLAHLVADMEPADYDAFAATLDEQVITNGEPRAAAITDPRADATPHWRAALYMIDRDGDAVTVKLMVFTCPC